ncbi:polysaccharide lyase family 7 protein [uncultured Sphaerotilus sp.]|uniref:polysaccharide lyase family 7 protein n=1 Tax=uncultured Sphaerotilus sp. TaxID=474984 RepID=UPI0030CA36D4
MAASPPPPASLLDLTHVTLTLPVKSDGTTGGTPARTLKATELLPSSAQPRGYESEFFRSTLLSDAGDASAVTFWCPVTGALSSGTTDSPRTEFRHQLLAGTNDGWTTGDGSPLAMTVECMLTQLPPLRGIVVVAQVHGFRITDASGALVNAPPLLLVLVEPLAAGGYQLRAKVRRSADDSRTGYDNYVLKTFSVLQTWLTLQISVRDMKVWVNEVGMPIDPSWRDIGQYYKAGVYLDEVGTDAAHGGLLLMRQLVFR